MQIYIACGLTHVPRNHFEEYAKTLHSVARELESGGVHAVRYALINSDPQLATKPHDERARLCYLWDTQMVQEADLVVAECSFPSTGLGIELQTAAQREKPIIIIFRDYIDNRARPVHYVNPDRTDHELQIGEGFVSIMALGIPTIFRVHKYRDLNDALSQLKESVKLLQR